MTNLLTVLSVFSSIQRRMADRDFRDRSQFVRWTRWLVLSLLGLSGCQPSVPDKAPAKQAQVARTRVDRGPVSVTVEVTPETARLSDELELTLTVSYEPGIEIRKPPFGDAVGDFIVRGFRESLPSKEGSRSVFRQTYTLEPTQTGPSQVDPILVEFVDQRPAADGKSHQIETEAVTIQIISPLAEQTPSLASLKGPENPVPLPTAGLTWWWWMGGALLTAIAIVAWFKFRTPIVASVISPREQAEQELAALWKSDLARNEVKSFYVKLTGIVRRYIEHVTGIHAPDQTTEEFLRDVGKHAAFPQQERQRLKEFLESADLVKFAAHQPIFQDIEESFRRAKVFVRSLSAEQPT